MQRNELWDQLANAIEMRGSQDQVLWSILGTFWATNALLLVSLFTTGDFPKNPLAGVVVAGAGLLVSLVWRLIQNRALAQIDKHERLIRALENRLQLDRDLTITWGSPGSVSGPRARTVMRVLGLVAFASWYVGLAIFAIRNS